MQSKIFSIAVLAISLLGCSKGSDSTSDSVNHLSQKGYNINTEADVSDNTLKHYTIMHGDSELNNSNKEVIINWDFGDGSEKVSGHEVMASHKYSPGSYIVEALLVNNDNSTIGIQEEIDVIDEYVTTPVITYSYIDNNRSKVAFRTTNIKENKDAYIYVWNFGDGITSTSEKNSINHTYTTYGTYKVSVVIKNKKHESISVSEKVIEVKNPVFKITCNNIVSNLEGNPFTCKPHLTDDPIGAINDISIEWKFNNGLKSSSSSIFTNNLNSINHEIVNGDKLEVVAVLRSSKFGYNEFGEKKGILSNIENLDFSSMYKVSNIECIETKNNIGEDQTDYLDLECSAKYINKGDSESLIVPNITKEDIRWNITVDKKHNIESKDIKLYDVAYIENGIFNDEINVPVVRSKIKLPKYLKDDFYKISLSVPGQENKLEKNNKGNEKNERLVSTLEYKTKYPCIKNVDFKRDNLLLSEITDLDNGIGFNGQVNVGYLNEENQCVESLSFRNKEINKNLVLNQTDIEKVYEAVNSNSNYVVLSDNESSSLEEVLTPSDLLIKTRVRENGIDDIFEEYSSNNVLDNPFKLQFNKKYNLEYILTHNTLDKGSISYKDDEEYSVFENVESHSVTPRLYTSNSYNVAFDTLLKLSVGLNDTPYYNTTVNKSRILIEGDESVVMEESEPYVRLLNTNITYDITAETKSPISNKTYTTKNTFKNNPLRIYSVKITDKGGDSKVYYLKDNNETITHTVNILRDKKYEYIVEVNEVREFSDTLENKFIAKNYDSMLRQGFKCSGEISSYSNSESRDGNNNFSFSSGSNSSKVSSCYSLKSDIDPDSSDNMYYKHDVVYNSRSERLDGSSDKYIMNYTLESKNTNSMNVNLVFDFKYTN